LSKRLISDDSSSSCQQSVTVHELLVKHSMLFTVQSGGPIFETS